MKNLRTLFIRWGLLLPIMVGAIYTAQADTTTVYGESHPLGQGTARTFAELNSDSSPVRIGIAFTPTMLEDLPTEMNMESRCFDVSGNGTTEMDECIGDYEVILTFPEEVKGNADIPFQWFGLNWNPLGHIPMIWMVPHFDFHFYTVSQAEVQAIRPGPCGSLINCDDFARATKPIPPQYLPANYVSVDDAVAAMGDHLIDTAAPEMSDPPKEAFTGSFNYGAYDGHIIFYEPMIALDFLLTQPDDCKTFSLPQAWETSGYYPTEYCIRYENNEYTVSLEKFVYREAQ
jgi:hypothetical protein